MHRITTWVWLGAAALPLAWGAATPAGAGEASRDRAAAETIASVAVESGFVDAGSGKLFYDSAGSGDAVVLIHDGILHSAVWDGQFGVFAADHRVVRYDRRGYGRSTVPAAPYSNVEDLHRLLDRLGIERATLMGISSGGGLAIDFTLQYPDRVDMLVLVGAVVSGLGYSDHFFTRGGHMTRADLQSPASVREYWTMKDPYLIAPGNHAAKQRAKRLLDENPQNMGDAHHAFLQRPHRPALPDLGRIAVPVLVLTGEEDIPDVQAHAGAIAAGIPGATRAVMAGAGHLVPLERPEEFNDEVRRFMSEARFMYVLNTAGVTEAVAAAYRIRKEELQWEPLSEERMNRLGYRYLRTSRTEQAIALLELNADVHPGSWNAHDSLGEAYLEAGDRARAIASYRRSLDLNPGNRNAVEKLATIEKE